MKTKLMICFLVLMSWAASAQHDHHDHEMRTDKKDEKVAVFKDKSLGSAYNSYGKLKDALIASNDEEAKMAAEELQNALASVNNGKKAFNEAVKVATASSLEHQRLAFDPLTTEMVALIKGGKLSAGEVYIEYCPMANNNQGGYWLSNEKVIKNPYFGDKMLKCGSVKETIQ